MSHQFAHPRLVLVVVVIFLVAGTERTRVHVLLAMSHHAMFQSEALMANVTFKGSLSYNNERNSWAIFKPNILSNILPFDNCSFFFLVLTCVGPHVAP